MGSPLLDSPPLSPSAGPGHLSEGATSTLQSQSGSPAPLVVAYLEVGLGANERLELYAGDDAEEVAASFCSKHGLPASVRGPLAQHLLANLNRALSKMLEGGEGPAQQVTEAAISAETFSRQTSHIRRSLSRGRQSEVDDGRSQGVGLTAEDQAVEPTPFQPLPEASGESEGEDEGAAAKQKKADKAGARLYAAALERLKRQQQKRLEKEMDAKQQAQASRQLSWMSAELSKERKQGTFSSYFEMMYVEGLEAANQRAQLAAEAAERRKAEEEGEAELLAMQMYDSKRRSMRSARSSTSGCSERGHAPWQRLSKKKQNRGLEERMEQLRQEQELRETQECTFRPAINKASMQMVTERYARSPREVQDTPAHMKLFHDATRRQHRQKEYSTWLPEELTFHPQTNTSHTSQQHLARALQSLGAATPAGTATLDGASGGGGAVAMPVVDRLYITHERRLAKKQQMKALIDIGIDPTSGKLMFHPETNSGATTPRHAGSISDYLYNKAQQLESRRQHAAKELEQKRQEDANTHFSSVRSHKLSKKLKLSRFRKLFDCLNTSGAAALDLIAAVEAPDGPFSQMDAEIQRDLAVAAQLLKYGPDQHQEVPAPGKKQTVKDLGSANTGQVAAIPAPAPAPVPATSPGASPRAADSPRSPSMRSSENGDPSLPGPPVDFGGEDEDLHGSLGQVGEDGPVSPRQAATRSQQLQALKTKSLMRHSSKSLKLVVEQQPPSGEPPLQSFEISPSSTPASPAPAQQTAGLPSNQPAKPAAVTLEEFVALMERVLAACPHPRRYLGPVVKKQVEEPSFKPTINGNAARLAQHVRPTNVPTHEFLHEIGRMLKDKREALRQVAADDELRECSFTPSLVSSHRPAHGRIHSLIRDPSNTLYHPAAALQQYMDQAGDGLVEGEDAATELLDFEAMKLGFGGELAAAPGSPGAQQRRGSLASQQSTGGLRSGPTEAEADPEHRWSDGWLFRVDETDELVPEDAPRKSSKKPLYVTPPEASEQVWQMTKPSPLAAWHEEKTQSPHTLKKRVGKVWNFGEDGEWEEREESIEDDEQMRELAEAIVRLSLNSPSNSASAKGQSATHTPRSRKQSSLASGEHMAAQFNE